MATKLDILVIPTYNTLTLGVADASTYDGTPSAPTMDITIPGFGDVSIPFNINDFNVYNSTILGITQMGDPLLPLPDGLYTLKYTITPANEYFVVRNIMRVEQLQEKFDAAFMKLDMMECDLAIKTQQKVDLTSINFFIQGSIAAANNCAIDTANKLYNQASKMLNNFMRNGCQCSGTNYLTNFY
jgi:hypothetical protein